MSLTFDIAAQNERTLAHWRHAWIANARVNREERGPFGAHSVLELWGRGRGPALCLGAGPSLESAVDDLRVAQRKGMRVLSCLRSFSFLESASISPDYYVTLDASPLITNHITDALIERTIDKTLVAHVSTDPDVLRRWRGRILFFASPPQEASLSEEYDKIERFNVFVESGGNVFGSCVYIAKAILGANPVVLLGADLSFPPKGDSYAGGSPREDEDPILDGLTDICGAPVSTIPQYYAHKLWLDDVCSRVPGIWINCSEAGIVGAVPGGMNLTSPINMSLRRFLAGYSVTEKTLTGEVAF